MGSAARDRTGGVARARARRRGARRTWAAVGDRAGVADPLAFGAATTRPARVRAGVVPVLAPARALRAVGSVGDALRRGVARDLVARRLDQPVVGAGSLVLVQADPDLLVRSAGVERERHRLLARL